MMRLQKAYNPTILVEPMANIKVIAQIASVETVEPIIPSRNSFRRDERGQISVLFVFAILALVFLVALIFNTAKQTTRKMEMQNAADGAAVAGSVTMARGMNLMVMNNNTMADVLAVMITVRSLLQTSEAMVKAVIPAMILAFSNPFTAALVPELTRELGMYASLEATLRVVDNFLSGSGSGIGWQIMKGLDKLNQAIKIGFPPMSELQTIKLAKLNGADRTPYGYLISGQSGTGLLPILPVVRGPQKLLAGRADECPLPKLKWPARGILILTGPISSIAAIPIFEIMVNLNVASLGGGTTTEQLVISKETIKNTRDKDGKTLQDRADEYNQGGEGRNADVSQLKLKNISFGLGTPPLEWPANPPRPMILTDTPVASASATTEKTEAGVKLEVVRKNLQFLAIVLGELKKGSPIGGERFPNVAPYQWVTYGQADVYNPTHWGMFSQDWRAKLVRAEVLEDKIDELAEKLGLRDLIDGDKDLSFVNTH
jgi:hypothetical protein